MLDLIPENLGEISSLLRRKGWTKSDIAALEIAGDGNMNRAYRARLVDGTTIILKQSVDHVAKYPSIPAPLERVAVEAAFYATIEGHRNIARSTPALLGYDEMHFLLAMDDLGEGSDYSDAYTDQNRRPSISTVKHLLGWLSTLHAIEPSADFPPNRAMRELNYQHIFDLPLNPNTHATIADNLGPNATAAAAAFAKDQELAAAAGALGQVYLGEAPFESTPALLHGDYYPGSWLRTETEPAVIDPEFAFVGPAEFDVGVFVAHLMFCGLPLDDATATLRDYDPPPNFEISLALGFTGMELVRRLLGVAQLPMPNNDDTKTEWLHTGRRLALGQGS